MLRETKRWRTGTETGHTGGEGAEDTRGARDMPEASSFVVRRVSVYDRTIRLHGWASSQELAGPRPLRDEAFPRPLEYALLLLLR